MKRTPIRKRNSARAKLAFLRNFHSVRRVNWIRSLACAFCGSRYLVRNAHMTSRGAGGDYTRILPLCQNCDERWTLGRKTFLAVLGLSWEDVEAKLAAVNQAWEEYDVAR